jgi:Beta-ketoacyl synthase, N-terminal domain
VHNAASGCWHIAVGSRATSTSLCAFDGSFAAGLLEAAASVRTTGRPVLLVASDSPYPEPLHAKRPLPDHVGVALLLAPERDARSIAMLTIALGGGEPGRCADRALEALRRAVPAAAALPLLAAVASIVRSGDGGNGGDGFGSVGARVGIDAVPYGGLQVDVAAVDRTVR